MPEAIKSSMKGEMIHGLAAAYWLKFRQGRVMG
jgi:hypothetical protein